MRIKEILYVFLILFLKDGQCDLVSCPFNSQCFCQKELAYAEGNQISSVSCNKTPFSRLPALPDAGVDRVQITESGLGVLEDDSFGNLRSRYLNLDINGIYFIANRTFMQMNRSLEELSLNDNLLNDIPMNALFPLESLRILKLDGNKISSVVVDWANLKNSLNELYLSFNNIYSLPLNPETSLSNFKVLNQIHLAGNLLVTLERNSLPYTLKLLNASSNFIKDLPQDLLNNLQELQNLYLRDNVIELIPTQKYEGKINLQNLDLSQNVINTIKKPISNSLKVNNYDLSYNKINNIDKEAFSGFDCKSINLESNKLSKIDEKTFSGIESTLEHLDLSKNKFPKFPDGIKDLKYLKTFKLAYNNLYKLKSALNSLNGLEKFSVAGNSLAVFPYESLGPLRSLTDLDLSYNKIAEVRKSDFKAWGHNLERLSLKSNSLFYLDNNTFEYVPQLQELSLSYNVIGDIFLGAFKNLDKLQKLDLSSSLKGYGFPTPILSLKALKYLALDNNNVNSIPKDITKLESIKTLILDFNRIKEIESSIFDSKAHKFLKDLRLSFNFISKIESNTFSDLNGLQYISLHDNKIMKVADYAFINLPHNLSIYLSNNRIEDISKSAFSSIPYLKILDLHNNNLQSFDYNVFQNVTNNNAPMLLNLSRNRIDSLKVPDYQRAPVYISTLDLSHNKITKIPEKLVEIQTSLKVLDLGYNEIATLESQNFYSMVELESLSIVHNKIQEIKDNTFVSLKKLQVLNLAHNHIDNIDAGLFKDLEALRVLDLSFNNIRTISISGFDNTKLERLYLSNNKLTIMPSSSILNIGKTLRFLDLSNNHLNELESNFFQFAPKLQSLNLCQNNLTSGSLSVFQNASSLLKIELCSNYLVTLSDDTFKNCTYLKYLNLGETSLHTFPNFTFPNLIHLNVSGNRISNMSESSLSGLPKLSYLNLSGNNLTELNRINWIQIPNLNELDLSHNPIKKFEKPCFFGLDNLRKLNIQYLVGIELLDSGIFMDLDQLVSLKIDFQRKFNLNLTKTLEHLKYLKELSIHFLDTKIADEIPAELPKKLRYLEITGENLKYVDDNLTKGLKGFNGFKLRISGTSIKDFPKHFFNGLKNKGFSLDLSNNKLEHIGPELLYYTFGDIRRYGTKAFEGGINVEGNPLVCGCNVKWFSEWLRRYLVETMDVNNRPIDTRLEMIENMSQITCSEKKTNQKFPILNYDLTSDELLCGIVLNFPKVKDEKNRSIRLLGVSSILYPILFTIMLWLDF